MNARAKAIVREAWEITTHEKQLLKFGFWPSFFGILVGGTYTFYQIDAFGRSEIFYNKTFIDFSALFSQLVSLMHNNIWLFVGLIALILFIVVSYIFVPIVCTGALVHKISYIHKEKDAKLFEMSLLKNGMKPISFFTEWSFIIRNLGVSSAGLLTPFLILFTIIGSILLFLFAFTSQFIVIEKSQFANSIVKSIKLVIQNIGTTFSLFLIIILIELRVILNIAVILFIPIVIFWISGLFATMFNILSIVSTSIVVLALVSITAYITGALSVFAHGIWTIAYMDFKEKLEA